MALVKQNYLNNKDMLLEIHRSKNSFSSFTQPEYHRYDIILSSLDDINDETIEQAKRQHAKRHTDEIFNFKKNDGEKIKIAECEFDIAQIKDSDLIFRIMTFDHIPKNCIRKKTIRTVADGYDKVNFPPFQHWKFNDNRELICVGKSHWNGPVDTGHFDRDHGNISNNLASMMIKLCERYSTRGNVRNYCVDTETQALTKRGWLGIDDITTDDIILSYSKGSLVWSKIKSVFHGTYANDMMHLTALGLDAMITPSHKMMTTHGLIPAEQLKLSDELILMGSSVADPDFTLYSNDEITDLISKLETNADDSDIDLITITALTEDQRYRIIHELFPDNQSNTRTRIAVSSVSYEKISIIQTICALSGIRLNYEVIDHPDNSTIYIDYTLIDQHLLPVYDIKVVQAGTTDTKHVNQRIWCPETDYGCFIAKRNNKVYCSGNTYNDEMKCQAILQLTQVGLQFDESKSDNPFGYFSQVVTNSFLRILNIEKKNQNIRDDILELNGMNPSYTRLHNSEYEYEMKRNSYDD